MSYFSDDLTEDNINDKIKETEAKLVRFRELKDKVSKLNMYECGIRKSDHRVCYFRFSLGAGGDCSVQVTVPSHNESYTTTIDTFITDFVAYSEKTRALLPKRSKK